MALVSEVGLDGNIRELVFDRGIEESAIGNRVNANHYSSPTEANEVEGRKSIAERVNEFGNAVIWAELVDHFEGGSVWCNVES